MPTLLVKTYPELSSFAQSEITEILKKKAAKHKIWNDFIEVETEQLDVATLKMVLFGRCFSHLYWKVGETKVASDKQLYQATKDALKWHKTWPAEKKFAVDPKTDDTFTSKKIGKKVGQAIVDDFRTNKGERSNVDLEDPDITVLARVKDANLTLAIDLTGKKVNTDIEMLNQSLLKFGEWKVDSPLGEIFYAGISNTAYTYAKKIAQRTKISGMPFSNLTIINKKRTLSLLRKRWEKDIFPTLLCFENMKRDNFLTNELVETEKIEIYPLSKIPKADVHYFFTNLVKRKPDKRGQKQYLDTIFKKIAKNKTHTSYTLLLREDIPLPNGKKRKTHTAPRFQGINTKMVKLPKV